MSNPEHCDIAPPVTRHVQQWILSEPEDERRLVPIVDGKYHDPDTSEVIIVADRQSTTTGPPVIDQYWHNLRAGPPGQFRGMRGAFFKDITEYIIRLGEFLKKEHYKIHSLTATEFSVTVVIETMRTRAEVSEDMTACRLHFTLD
ncbi:hypothetical protein EsH8_II_000707 [Colletotrichum jinshuiense]